MKKIIYISLLVLTAACNSNHPMNLIVNGNAELPRYDSTPGGWIKVTGNWKSVKGDSSSHDYAWAQNGKYLFFEGQDLSGILSQSIDVGKYSTSIDKNSQQFIFSGFVQAFPQDPPDQCQIRIACLKDTASKPLYSFSSDTISSVSKWHQVSDTFTAPANTRFIQIQLIAQRRNGADNDGYFDNISLVPQATGFVLDKKWMLVIIAIALLTTVAVLSIYRNVRKRKSKAFQVSNPNTGRT